MDDRVTRRELIKRAGAGAAALGAGGLLSALGKGEAAPKLLPGHPLAPYESPITPERVEFLKGKPYRGVTINVMVVKATVGDCVKYHAPHWEAETGGKVNIAEVPIETLHQQIFTDLTTGLGRYDAYQTGAWFYGDFFVPKEPYIVPLEDFLKDPRHPYWVPTDQIKSMRTLYTWEGRQYGALFDADCQILYYREDILTRPDYRKRFKAKYGYDLPVPPRTMDEMHDVADFFTGWDWNGDGQPDWGIALHAKVNEQGFFHFLTLAAPYVISPENRSFWFDPDTMEPYINSEGHVKALEDYAKFVKNGPRAMLQWTLGQGWNLFLAGHSVMEPTWGDLPTLAQDPKASKVKGKIGAAQIPGTKRAFNPKTGQWKSFTLNQVGNVNGGSWHLVLSRFSKNKEATYDFMAFMANKKNALFNAANGWTGVQPSMPYEFFPPYGTATVKDYEQYGWNAHDIKVYLDAYYKDLTNPLQETYLRIPGAAEYWHELDVNVSAVLAGQMKPKAALDDVARKWQKITERYGKDTQRALYRKSLGLE
jgi:multiple sugar transport system substrate-binding protein